MTADEIQRRTVIRHIKDWIADPVGFYIGCRDTVTRWVMSRAANEGGVLVLKHEHADAIAAELGVPLAEVETIIAFGRLPLWNEDAKWPITQVYDRPRWFRTDAGLQAERTTRERDEQRKRDNDRRAREREAERARLWEESPRERVEDPYEDKRRWDEAWR
ncbi:MAG TPA: hypothetical protein VM869_19210 [Enhygromyxa sp.]|jgi:hypothetical protein|nr:hypothetical protein [Enhygromyxa sp.]